MRRVILRKKCILSCIIGCMLITFVACGNANNKNAANNEGAANNTESVVDREVDDNQTKGLSYADLVGVEFDLSSGAGAWATSITIDADGTFEGNYHDSEMGDSGADYPNGTLYESDFTGKFGELEKVDDFTYKTTVVEINYKNEVGTEKIEDCTRYVQAEAYGLADGKDFYFYLKGKKIADLPDGFMPWIQNSINESKDETELSIIGLYNETMELGFCGYSMLENYDVKYQSLLEESKEIDLALEHDDMTQYDYNVTSEYYYEIWDDHLNYLWTILKGKLSEEEMSKLKTEEQAWIKQKDKAMEEAAAEYEGGSMASMVYYNKGVELIKERVLVLQKYL